MPCRFLYRLLMAGAMTLATTQFAFAGPQDYQFQVVEPELHQGDSVTLTVAITDRRTNTPVLGATIIAVQIDMSPDGMANMRPLVMPTKTTTPGRYGFVTKLGMAGNWRLALAARLPGEAEVIWREVIIRVAP